MRSASLAPCWGIADLRRQNSGKESLLSDEQQAQLWQVLQYPAPDGGLWNGRKVADWLSEITGRRISRHRGWEYLQQMTFRLRVPRPDHRVADPVEQNEWKKNYIKNSNFCNLNILMPI